MDKRIFPKNFNNTSLYIEKELLRYDGTSLICICKDTEDNLYLTHCYEDWKNYSCLITKIDEADLSYLATIARPYLVFEKSKEMYNLHNDVLTKLDTEEFKKLDAIGKDFQYTENIRKVIEKYYEELYEKSFMENKH